MSKALYRNELVPPYEFVVELKKVDPELYVVFDSVSMRWDIYFKDRTGCNHLVHRVCERDSEGRDIAFRPLDHRVIRELMRMDLARRNISAEQYKNKVREAEDLREARKIKEYDDATEYAFKYDKRQIDRAYDALRGVYRKF